MAKRSFLSPSWYRVAEQTPRLKTHAEIHRQRFRGETWYILQDHQTGRFHRLSPAANLFVCLLDGRRTVNAVWQTVCERFEDDPPTQDEIIRLLSQLHAADLLASAALPNLDEVAHRHDSQARKNLLMKLRNPMALRFPLFDPDRLLDATIPIVRPLFTVVGFLLWLALIATGIAIAWLEWPALTGGLADRVLSAENVLIIFFAYPIVKFIHELGHAYATKVWGGEVHEVGVMFLVFIPIPYVDASASSAFAEKWRRAVVGGAGIMVELALAAGALIFWSLAEPGIARAFAFNVVLIGSISTLFFNGNPLLRFDGYYVLADLIEVPNLGTRANKYLAYVTQRYGFGLHDTPSPTLTDSERKWLFGYAVGSFIYRIFITVVIALFVATKLFIIGVLLAIWGLTNALVLPILKGLKFVFFSPKLRHSRGRAVTLTGGTVAALLAIVFLLPLPHATVARGVVWVPSDAIVRTGTDGFVAEVSEPVDGVGLPVAARDVVVRMEDPVIDARIGVLEARVAEHELRLNSVRALDPVQERLVEEQVRHLRAELAFHRERRDQLAVAAPAAGTFVAPDAAGLMGRYLAKGEQVGYVVRDGGLTLRVVVPQTEADLVRGDTGAVAVRFVHDLATSIPARIVREVPAADRALPSLALSTEAGGDVVLDPSAGEGQALESLFQFDVALDDPQAIQRVGERVYVRFDHGREPLAGRLYRSARQLFLSRLNV